MNKPPRLQERDDCWILSLGLPVTGLQLGMQFLLQFESAGERVTIRIENVFQLAEGCVVREFDPEKPATLGPALAVVHKVVERAVAFKDGRLRIEFEDGRRITVGPHPQCGSWQISAPGLCLVSEIGEQLSIWDGQD